jgi:tRNA nucleotidyltransferase (CCA-adding enzyme)
VEANWPLVVPPILTLIDDDSPNYKAKGCELLAILLAATPPALLARTGLGEVFYDAMMPCLSYLPSLTPQDQSLHLLGETYPALIALSRVRYPSDDNRKERMEMLDQVLRKGVLKGHFHCSDNVRITEFLVNQLRLLINEMGIWSVKHLKVGVVQCGQ